MPVKYVAYTTTKYWLVLLAVRQMLTLFEEFEKNGYKCTKATNQTAVELAEVGVATVLYVN